MYASYGEETRGKKGSQENVKLKKSWKTARHIKLMQEMENRVKQMIPESGDIQHENMREMGCQVQKS